MMCQQEPKRSTDADDSLDVTEVAKQDMHYACEGRCEGKARYRDVYLTLKVSKLHTTDV